MTRRNVMLTAGLAGGLASGMLLAGMAPGVGHALADEAEATAVPSVTTDGIGGGGVVPTGYGNATFALTAFALPDAEGKPVFNGGFTLSDPNFSEEPILMVSQFFNEIIAFSTAQPNARQIMGWALVNERGPYPYMLQVSDIGAIDKGEDSFNLVFGNAALPFMKADAKNCDCAGFTYSLRGTVAQGDLIFFPLALTNPGQ